MKNVFDGLSILNVAEERISELEDMTIETSKTENQREKKNDSKTNKLGQNVQELCNSYKRCNIHLMEIPER